MTPFEKFKETAALVNVWIREEQPKRERFGCKNCQYLHGTFESFDRFFTNGYCVCNCLPYWHTPIAQIDECPKKNNPNAGRLSSICRVNTEV